MSDFDVFARYYDADFAGFLDDLPLYAGYASDAGGPLLELACGTGRLLSPLARAGHTLVGIDVSTAMLSLAADRLASADVANRVTLLESDMRHLREVGDRRFRLAFCAINSFLHLPDQPSQLAALRAVRQHLEPGGRLILDVFHPHPDVLADYDGRLVHEGVLRDPMTGDRVDKFVSRTLDAATQSIQTTFIFDRIDQAGALDRQLAPFVLRYIQRYELELLLMTAGYRLEDIHGSYSLDAFDSDSLQMIAVARPAY
jgi:ubiquinone/menaquinone biosynthesis C-methylase UbiE